MREFYKITGELLKLISGDIKSCIYFADGIGCFFKRCRNGSSQVFADALQLQSRFACGACLLDDGIVCSINVFPCLNGSSCAGYDRSSDILAHRSAGLLHVVADLSDCLAEFLHSSRTGLQGSVDLFQGSFILIELRLGLLKFVFLLCYCFLARVLVFLHLFELLSQDLNLTRISLCLRCEILLAVCQLLNS